MNTTIDFTPSRTFRRFKEVKKVKVNDEVYNVIIDREYVTLAGRESICYHKDNLYIRWITIGDVLHYIQRINHWMGGTKCNYIKAEIV